MSLSEENLELSDRVEFKQTVGVREGVWLNEIKQWLLVYRMDLSLYEPSLLTSCGIFTMLGE